MISQSVHSSEYQERLDRADEQAQKLALSLERNQRDALIWSDRAKKAHKYKISEQNEQNGRGKKRLKTLQK